MTAAKIVVWTACLVSVVVAGLALAAGIQHNTQGEFFDATTGSFDVVYAALIFGSWFVLSFIIVGACGAVVIAVTRVAKRRWLDPGATRR